MTEEYKPASTIEDGDHVLNCDGVHRVVGRYNYRDGDGIPSIAATLHPVGLGRSNGPWIARWKTTHHVRLASAADVERAVAAARRDVVDRGIDMVRRAMNLNRLPITAAGLHISIGLGSSTELRAWADALGVAPMETRGGGRVNRNLITDLGDGDLAEVKLFLHCPSDLDVCPDPWHEQPGEPTEPCPACGDQPPAVSAGVTAEASAITATALAEPTQEWLFTFGAGQQHDGRFVRITGTYATARARMVEVFGRAWCDQYDWRSFDALGLLDRMAELPESEWPTAATDEAPAGADQAASEDDGCPACGRLHFPWCAPYGGPGYTRASLSEVAGGDR
ncbi:hypothetical protein AWW66_03520 [Micromonospora rosaria]|uniref:Uncharacterized protein n=1 Tax=Micromonospora rosaria TaxID=47874 RepID=A0A136PYX0_9ACTN|nr:hypothetical protein [Micromonospora rosaria]KXK63396.1 hypothetical protein AWW66_03520 [Micromonospora rosaria]